MDYDFHLKGLNELLRVTKSDVRLYPLPGPDVQEHKYLKPIMDGLSANGFLCEIIPVKQRDVIGAERMLRLANRTAPEFYVDSLFRGEV